MLIVVDPHSGVPAYKQLMDQVKFHVSSGLLKPGDELPSTRALSSQLGLNPMTISKAYSYLEKEGVIERRPGRPLVVKALESDKAARKRIEQVKEAFAPVVTMIRQLGIGDDEALKILSEMLKKDGETKGVGHGDDGSDDVDRQGARSKETGDDNNRQRDGGGAGAPVTDSEGAANDGKDHDDDMQSEAGGDADSKATGDVGDNRNVEPDDDDGIAPAPGDKEEK